MTRLEELRALCEIWAGNFEDDIHYQTRDGGTTEVTIPGVEIQWPFVLTFPGTDEMATAGIILGASSWLLQQWGFHYELIGSPKGATCTVTVGEGDAEDVISVETGMTAAAATLKAYLSARWLTKLWGVADLERVHER